mmetsp:Transcript_10493/g.14816  ORF Transcript_10493/g.14816 Transcript_10493/m.14816 type:complete len:733 (+) Transcript_10493:102-2300(+)
MKSKRKKVKNNRSRSSSRHSKRRKVKNSELDQCSEDAKSKKINQLSSSSDDDDEKSIIIKRTKKRSSAKTTTPNQRLKNFVITEDDGNGSDCSTSSRSITFVEKYGDSKKKKQSRGKALNLLRAHKNSHPVSSEFSVDLVDSPSSSSSSSSSEDELEGHLSTNIRTSGTHIVESKEPKVLRRKERGRSSISTQNKDKHSSFNRNNIKTHDDHQHSSTVKSDENFRDIMTLDTSDEEGICLEHFYDEDEIEKIDFHHAADEDETNEIDTSEFHEESEESSSVMSNSKRNKKIRRTKHTINHAALNFAMDLEDFNQTSNKDKLLDIIGANRDLDPEKAFETWIKDLIYQVEQNIRDMMYEKARISGGESFTRLGHLITHEIGAAFPRYTSGTRQRRAASMIEGPLCTHRESTLSSCAWTTDFRQELMSRPIYRVRSLPPVNVSIGLKLCEVCGRENHNSKYLVSFHGRRYHAMQTWEIEETRGHVDWIRCIRKTDTESHMSSKKHKSTIDFEFDEDVTSFYVGEHCKARTQLYHKLLHYKFHTMTRIQSLLLGIDNNNYDATKRDKLNSKRNRKRKDLITIYDDHNNKAKDVRVHVRRSGRIKLAIPVRRLLKDADFIREEATLYKNLLINAEGSWRTIGGFFAGTLNHVKTIRPKRNHQEPTSKLSAAKSEFDVKLNNEKSVEKLKSVKRSEIKMRPKGHKKNKKKKHRSDRNTSKQKKKKNKKKSVKREQKE